MNDLILILSQFQVIYFHLFFGLLFIDPQNELDIYQKYTDLQYFRYQICITLIPGGPLLMGRGEIFEAKYEDMVKIRNRDLCISNT